MRLLALGLALVLAWTAAAGRSAIHFQVTREANDAWTTWFEGLYVKKDAESKSD